MSKPNQCFMVQKESPLAKLPVCIIQTSVECLALEAPRQVNLVDSPEKKGRTADCSLFTVQELENAILYKKDEKHQKALSVETKVVVENFRSKKILKIQNKHWIFV